MQIVDGTHPAYTGGAAQSVEEKTPCSSCGLEISFNVVRGADLLCWYCDSLYYKHGPLGRAGDADPAPRRVYVHRVEDSHSAGMLGLSGAACQPPDRAED